MRIRDAGLGFDPDAAPDPGRFGLRSMHERAVALGGQFRLSAMPGRGTEVEVEL
jgi:signal transduction histidine kinase